jgi:23S rRNA pseudouridine1911/1915/1917 synthase
VTFTVPPAGEGERLDQWLAGQGLPISRSQIKRRIDEGEVTVNGRPGRPSQKLRAGDAIVVTLEPPRPVEVVAEEIPLEVLYQDRHLVVIDKPPGLVVHPAAGHASGTLVNALLHHVRDLSGIGGELRPGIVHRLDKDTSGVLVVAKDDATHAALSARFKTKDLLRLYHAVVSPPPRTASGTISTLYGRHPKDRKRFTSKVAEGKPAVTHWRVLERFGDDAALVECRLETGRTHQIRVHLSEHGWPVLADPVYGKKPKDPWLRELSEKLGRQALHASVLAFLHPITGEQLRFETPLPADVTALVEGLRAGRPAEPRPERR